MEFGGGNDARFQDGFSRWGIKGSNDVSEGLTANYRFETKLSTANAESSGGGDEGGPGGRLAYVGLSGGFGNLSLGQVWSASYNHVGGMVDPGPYYTEVHTSYRVPSALSYSVSAGAVSMQIDAIMDPSRDTGEAIDQLEFGLSFDLGDIGEVGLAMVESKATNVKSPNTDMGVAGTPYEPAVADTPTMYMLNHDDDANTPSIRVEPVEVTVYVKDSDGADVTVGTIFLNDEKEPLATFVNNINRDNNGYFIGTTRCTPPTTGAEDDACETETKTVYVQTVRTINQDTTITDPAGVDNDASVVTMVREVYFLLDEADNLVITEEDNDSKEEVAGVATKFANTEELAGVKPGEKSTHIAVKLNIGGVSPYIGYSEIDVDNDGINEKGEDVMKGKDKITYYGVSGGIGDSGLSFHVAARNKKMRNGTKESPWSAGLTRSLGGGATAMVEHANNDDGKSGQTWVGLKVDF